MSRSHEKLVGALLAVTLAGCAAQRYADLPEKNLQVSTAATGASVVMGVHRLDDKCFAHSEGTVTLDRPQIDVGLPSDRLTLLVFEFYSLSLFSGSKSIRKEARLLPRPGYRYEASVSYKNSLYDVDVLEVDTRTGSRRELDTRRGC